MIECIECLIDFEGAGPLCPDCVAEGITLPAVDDPSSTQVVTVASTGVPATATERAANAIAAITEAIAEPVATLRLTVTLPAKIGLPEPVIHELPVATPPVLPAPSVAGDTHQMRTLPPITFREWVAGFETNRSMIGQIARYVAADLTVPTDTRAAFLAHFLPCGSPRPDVAKTVWQAFEGSQKPLRPWSPVELPADVVRDADRTFAEGEFYQRLIEHYHCGGFYSELSGHAARYLTGQYAGAPTDSWASLRQWLHDEHASQTARECFSSAWSRLMTPKVRAGASA